VEGVLERSRTREEKRGGVVFPSIRRGVYSKSPPTADSDRGLGVSREKISALGTRNPRRGYYQKGREKPA